MPRLRINPRKQEQIANNRRARKIITAGVIGETMFPTGFIAGTAGVAAGYYTAMELVNRRITAKRIKQVQAMRAEKQRRREAAQKRMVKK